MFFPVLGAHVSGSEFQYPNLSCKELCGKMANLLAESGGNNGQLSHLQTPGGSKCCMWGKDGQPRNGVSRLSKRRIKGHETAYRENPCNSCSF